MTAASNDTRVLLIGFGKIGGLPAVPWSGIESVNPADHDLVLFNCASLVDFVESEFGDPAEDFDAFSSDLANLGRRVGRLLASGGKTVVFCPDEQTATLDEGDFDYDCLQWLPIPIRISLVSGTTCDVKIPSWAGYYSLLAQWRFYFGMSAEDVDQALARCGTQSQNERTRTRLDPIATSRANEYLGVRIRAEFLTDAADRTSQVWGEIYLVPCVNEEAFHRGAELALQDVFSITTVTEAPDWADEIELPGLDELDRKMDETGAAIGKATAERAELEAKRGRISRWRGLVYETGTALQELCEEAFQELGASTRPSDVSDEFIVIIDQKEMLVEVKGVGKSAAKSHVAQLVVDAEQRQENEFDQLALIVNAWRTTPLAERGTADKPWFPDNVVRTASGADVVLISTETLLQGLIKHWGAGSGPDMLAEMMTVHGVYRPSHGAQ